MPRPFKQNRPLRPFRYGRAVAWLLGMKLGLGLAGIWMAFAMDECLRGIIFWARWKSGRWKDLQTV